MSQWIDTNIAQPLQRDPGTALAYGMTGGMTIAAGPAVAATEMGISVINAAVPFLEGYVPSGIPTVFSNPAAYRAVAGLLYSEFEDEINHEIEYVIDKGVETIMKIKESIPKL